MRLAFNAILLKCIDFQSLLMNNDANDSKRGTDDVSDDDVADKLTPLCSPITSAGI